MQYGRRNVILVTSLPFCLSWVLTVVAPCVEVMFVTAFVAGLCCAIVVIVTQVNQPSLREIKTNLKLKSPGLYKRNFITGHPRIFERSA